jgi:hypothetical protein
VFHVELRQFPHQARAFNLTREELDSRILSPWISGGAVELDDRRWSSDRARLTIYEAPHLDTDQLGMGRGWGNATREGTDVTDRLLAEVASPTPVAELKRELLERCAYGPLSLPRLVELAGDRYPQSRVSERLALCEQAVWELLHEGAIGMSRGGTLVARAGSAAALGSVERGCGDDPGRLSHEVVDQLLALGLRAEQVAVNPQ